MTTPRRRWFFTLRTLGLVIVLLPITLIPIACTSSSLVETDDAETYEVTQTKNFFGFDVKDFPAPQGPIQFDELPADAPKLSFAVTSNTLSGPPPAQWFEKRKQVLATSPTGEVIEAYCGWADDQGIEAGNLFKSAPENRRHLYGPPFPSDIFIGQRMNGQLKPLLFFRDVGSHNTAPHSLAIGSDGRCHLMVADVAVDQNNRLKLLWMVGDMTTGKWTDAWLVDHRMEFSFWSQPWSASWKDTVHLVWTANTPGPSGHAGIFHVNWSPTGFGRKVRIHKSEVMSADLAIDRRSGLLLIVFGTEDQVFVSSRPADGSWTSPVPLHSELKGQHDVSVQPTDSGDFIIRTKADKTSEWLLKLT